MTEFTLEELAQAVRGWCNEHRIFPANGQVAEEITERNIRYYRTLGLLDPPIGNYAKTFSDKHRLQLIAIRLYQAQGLPLRRIRDELYGRSLEDLAQLEKHAGQAMQKTLQIPRIFSPMFEGESWSAIPLGDEFLLISRRNRQLPRSIIEKINELVLSVQPQKETTDSSRN
jgi:DNA-binding transcriptional MerR regulator